MFDFDSEIIDFPSVEYNRTELDDEVEGVINFFCGSDDDTELNELENEVFSNIFEIVKSRDIEEDRKRKQHVVNVRALADCGFIVGSEYHVNDTNGITPYNILQTLYESRYQSYEGQRIKSIQVLSYGADFCPTRYTDNMSMLMDGQRIRVTGTGERFCNGFIHGVAEHDLLVFSVSFHGRPSLYFEYDTETETIVETTYTDLCWFRKARVGKPILMSSTPEFMKSYEGPSVLNSVRQDYQAEPCLINIDHVWYYMPYEHKVNLQFLSNDSLTGLARYGTREQEVIILTPHVGDVVEYGLVTQQLTPTKDHYVHSSTMVNNYRHSLMGINCRLPYKDGKIFKMGGGKLFTNWYDAMLDPDMLSPCRSADVKRVRDRLISNQRVKRPTLQYEVSHMFAKRGEIKDVVACCNFYVGEDNAMNKYYYKHNEIKARTKDVLMEIVDVKVPRLIDKFPNFKRYLQNFFKGEFGEKDVVIKLPLQVVHWLIAGMEHVFEEDYWLFKAIQELTGVK